MNRHNKQFDNLDALFNTARSTEAYLPDTGFSDRVMTSLPAKCGAVLSNWKKHALIIGSAIVGSVTAAALVPTIKLPVGQLLANLSSFTFSPELLVGLVAGLFGLSWLALWASDKELI